MPLSRALLQTLGAVALLAATLACGGKGGSSSPSAASSVVISGKVTYKRVPLAKDANGVPTGLKEPTAANLVTLPARGVVMRAYQQIQQTNPDNTTTLIWTIVRNGLTDSNGAYSLTVPKDKPTMVEVLSSFTAGGDLQVNLVGEPSGMQSTTGVLDRLRYALRKGADGSAPANVNTPNHVVTADAVVDFAVDLNDAWWLVDPSFNISSTESPMTDKAVLETSLPGRSAGAGSGSRILGIGDSIASFTTTYGSATPGTTLDLHYWMGRSEPRGSYIEYDRSRFPQSFDSTTGRYHYFGSIRGDATNDDAWDEGVIFPLLGRGFLFANNLGRTFSVPSAPLLPPASPQTDLVPDMARIEGLADAMAANLLKSPYLADTQGTGLAAPVVDIRDVSGLLPSQLTPYSAPAIRAFAWQVILKANSLTSPGTDADWATINPAVIPKFFIGPSPTKAATDTAAARDLEPISIYNQIARLKEGKVAGETVDLAAIFTDTTLTSLATPFGITWPRPTSGSYASFVSDWGTDPTSTLPAVTFSMAKAALVDGSYPNLSPGEVFYAGFNLSADKRCTLTASISPALGAGAQVDVDLPFMLRTFTFSGSGGTTDPIVLPVYATAPYFHPVRLQLKSPSSLQPDVVVTLTITPAP